MAVTGSQNNAVTQGVTQNKFRVTLNVEGNDWGVWDQKTGGKLASNTTIYNPGGGAAQVVLIGTQTVDALVLTRLYDLQRDHKNIASLFSAIGGGKCVVKQLPLDANGNAFGDAVVWTGVLTDVTAPDVDSNSNSAALITVTLSPNGNPTA